MTIVGWKKDPLKNGRAIIIDANINVNCTPGNKIFLQLEKDLVQFICPLRTIRVILGQQKRVMFKEKYL